MISLNLASERVLVCVDFGRKHADGTECHAVGDEFGLVEHILCCCFRSLSTKSSNSLLSESDDGIIHYRLVIDGQELLTGAFCNWVKACAGPAGEEYSFHWYIVIYFFFKESRFAFIEPFVL